MTSTAAPASIPMNLIAEPLVPADCTMRGLDFMPLYLDRLMSSRTWARVMSVTDLNLGGYLVNLWGAAFRNVPAGSIEDDDDVLRQATGCPANLWDRVRPQLLKGWLRCQQDGRVYHRGACDIIAGIWDSRQAKRADLAKARAVKAAKRSKSVPNQGNLNLPPVIVVTPVTPIPEPAESLRDNGDNQRIPLEPLATAPEAPSVTEQAQAFKPEAGSVKERGEPPLTPRATQRGTRLPDVWEPTAESHLFASRLGLNSDDAAEAFTDRSRGTGRRSPDWQAAFRDWCRGAHDRRQPRMAALRPGKLDGYADYAARRAGEVFGGGARNAA